MKNPRTIIVILELKTSAPLKDLRSKEEWQHAVDLFNSEDYPEVKQVSAQVAQSPKLIKSKK